MVGYLKQAKNFDVLVVRYKEEKLISGQINHCDYLLRPYVGMSRNAYMKGSEIKKSNHPILDSSDVFCVQGD